MEKEGRSLDFRMAKSKSPVEVELTDKFGGDGAHVRVAVDQNSIAASRGRGDQRVDQGQPGRGRAADPVGFLRDPFVHGNDRINHLFVMARQFRDFRFFGPQFAEPAGEFRQGNAA